MVLNDNPIFIIVNILGTTLLKYALYTLPSQIPIPSKRCASSPINDIKYPMMDPIYHNLGLRHRSLVLWLCQSVWAFKLPVTTQICKIIFLLLWYYHTSSKKINHNFLSDWQIMNIPRVQTLFFSSKFRPQIPENFYSEIWANYTP